MRVFGSQKARSSAARRSWTRRRCLAQSVDDFHAGVAPGAQGFDNGARRSPLPAIDVFANIDKPMIFS